jgi:acylglycerol lipase
VEFLEALRSAGCSVFTFDAHGHGKSEPLKASDRCLVWRYDDFVDDCLLFLDVVIARFQQLPPVFLSGTSNGGLTVSLAALKAKPALAGLMLFSPCCDVHWTPLLRILAPIGALAALLVPRAQIAPAIRLEDLGRDPAVLKRFSEDPLIFKGDVRARTAQSVSKGMRKLRAQHRHLDLPIFVAHGTLDRCTDPKASKAFSVGVKSASASVYHPIQDALHEILLGPEREQVFELAKSWAVAHTASKL